LANKVTTKLTTEQEPVIYLACLSNENRAEFASLLKKLKAEYETIDSELDFDDWLVEVHGVTVAYDKNMRGIVSLSLSEEQVTWLTMKTGIMIPELITQSNDFRH